MKYWSLQKDLGTVYTYLQGEVSLYFLSSFSSASHFVKTQENLNSKEATLGTCSVIVHILDNKTR